MAYEQLNQKVLEMQEDMLQAVKESVQIDSIKGEPQEGAPYGVGVKAALDHALELGKRMGFKTGCCDNRVGWIEYGEGEEMVAVLGHLDVVPLGEGWTYPPFGAEIHDGKMYGRGVLDDKGPTIGAFFALKAIQELGLKLDRRIRVMFGTDEENGSSCVKHYINSGEEMPTIGFTPDAEYPLIFFEKGASNFTVGKSAVKSGKVNVISLMGGTAANVVTPKCTLIAEGDLDVPESEDLTVRKEEGKTIIEAIGKGAHGSTPELGDNAAVKLFKAVKHIEFGGDFQQMMNFVLEKIAPDTNGEHLNICYRDEETGETTVNLGTLFYDANKMEITLDIRYPKNAIEEAVVQNVTESAGAYNLEILARKSVKPLYAAQDSEVVTKLMRVYEAITGRQEKPLAIGGGTYAKAFTNMVAFGPQFPGEEGFIHQPNECVSVDTLIKSLQITAAAMYELAQK